MISYETAKRIALEFFRKEGLGSAAVKLEKEGCVDDVFELLVRGQGKQEVERLYFKLPEQLRTYVLVMLVGNISQSLEDELMEVYGKFNSPRPDDKPERQKDFPQFKRESEEILLRYLRRR